MPEWLEGLGELPPGVIYLLAAALVAAETAILIGLFLPGEPVLLFVGFLAAVGTIDLGPAMVAVTVAALVGDSIAFFVGRRFGPRVRTARLGRWVGAQRWRRADAMLGRYGGRAVFAGRWVAVARTLMPCLAGLSGLRYARFLVWNVAAVLTYVPLSVLLGYVAGRSYAELERALGRATSAVLLLGIGVAGLVLVGRWLGRRPDPARALGRRLEQLPAVRWIRSRQSTSSAWISTRLGAAGAGVVNIAFGLAALFVLGWGVAELAERVVRTSGLPLVDPLVVRWIADRRDPDVTDAALAVATTVRGGLAVLTVGVTAGVVAVRARQRGSRAWLAPVGAFLSLLVLGLTVSWVTPETKPPLAEAPIGLFPTENVVVTASIGLLAWMATRRSRWSHRVAAWTGAAVATLLVTTSRAYLGWSWPSESAVSVLVGVVWDAVLIATWLAWERTPRRSHHPRPRPAPATATTTATEPELQPDPEPRPVPEPVAAERCHAAGGGDGHHEVHR